MEEKGLLIYAVKYRSHLDFLFLNSRLSQADLRPPVFAFDMRPILWLPASRAIRLIFSFLRHYLKEGAFPDPYQTGHYRELVLDREPSVLFLVGITDVSGLPNKTPSTYCSRSSARRICRSS
jgi:glycerol-3-phosphate O-acyltransferase